MTTPFDQLLEVLEAKDSALAEHLRIAADLMTRHGGIHLKMAAHALREFGVLLPSALGVERQRKGERLKNLAALAPRWRALQAETQGNVLPEQSDSDSSDSTDTRIPADLFVDTKQAYEALGNEDDFASVMATMVRILDPLGDATFHTTIGPEVRHWLALHKWFVKQCHATSLDALEKERGAFLEKWRLYETSLRAIFGRAIDTIPELLSLAARSPAEPGVLDRALALLKKAEPRRRFFLALDNPKWLAPLEARHLLDDPYPPVRKGDLMSFPPWPQSHFLISIAARAGPDVVPVIRRIGPKTENANVQADFVQAALEMAPIDGASLVGVFSRWLSGPVYMHVPYLLGNLGARLATGGQSAAALELLRAMLRFDVPRGRKQALRSVVPRIERYVYEATLKEVEQALVPAAGQELLDLLCSCLRRAVHAENGNAPDDYSRIWMPSLDPEDEYSDGVKEALVAAVLRVASAIARRSRGDSDSAIARLRKEEFLIFRRVELRVLAASANAPDMIRERLLDHETFEDDNVRPEYDRLLATGWSQLEVADQTEMLGWIRRGPDQQGLIERETERHGAPPADGVLLLHRESWQLARLQPLADVLEFPRFRGHPKVRHDCL